MSLPDGAEFWWSTKGYYASEEKRECKYWYYRVYIDDIFVKEGNLDIQILSLRMPFRKFCVYFPPHLRS